MIRALTAPALVAPAMPAWAYTRPVTIDSQPPGPPDGGDIRVGAARGAATGDDPTR